MNMHSSEEQAITNNLRKAITKMANQSTMDKMYEMRLSTMARAYRDLDEMPGAQDMTLDEKIATIVDAEWDARRVNKRTKLLRAASFSDQGANVADVRYDEDRKLDKALITELSNSKWIADVRNIVITGASGAGKTWLACALGVAACNCFYSVKYTRLPELLDELAVEKDENWVKAKKRYAKCDLLIIDDWLLEDVNAREAREMFEIIEARSRKGSLILCSQYSPSGWHSKLGEGAMADAVIDRVVYSSYQIHIEGEESMRKRMSRF